MRIVLVLTAGLGLWALIPGNDAAAQTRYSLFPERSSLFPGGGCSSFGGVNPCGSRRLPAPVGDPTDGPLTDSIRKGPLDPKPDPLGIEAELPVPKDIEPQALPSQKR